MGDSALAISNATVYAHLDDELYWDFDAEWADGDEVALSLTGPVSPTTSVGGMVSTGKRDIVVDTSTVSGWLIVDGVKKDHVGIVRLLPPPGSIPIKRAMFTTAGASYMHEGETITENNFKVSKNGKVSYTGAAFAEVTNLAILSVVITDSKAKAATVLLKIPISVRQPLPPRLAASGAPYNGWAVTAGESSDNIGTVYGIAFDGDLVKFPRHPKFRYEITQAVDLAQVGDEVGDALLVGKHHPAFKIGKTTGQVSYTGERLTGFQVRITIRITDKKNLAAPVEVISLVSVTQSGRTPSATPPETRTYNERHPAPAVWPGFVSDACPVKAGYVNFGTETECHYLTEAEYREYCADSRRWRRDHCRGWSPPYLTNSGS